MTKVRCTVEVGGKSYEETASSPSNQDSVAAAKNAVLMKSGKHIPADGEPIEMTCEEV